MNIYFSLLHFSNLNKTDIVVTLGRCETDQCVLTSLSLNHTVADGPQLLKVCLFDCLSVSFSSFSIRNCNLSVRSLILAAACISIAVVWGVYRNEDRYCEGTHALKTHNYNPSVGFTPTLKRDFFFFFWFYGGSTQSFRRSLCKWPEVYTCALVCVDLFNRIAGEG